MSVQPPTYSGQFDGPVPLSPPQAQTREQHRLPDTDPAVSDPTASNFADTDPAVSDPTASNFAKIVRWHPAINYFGYLADRIMPMSLSPDERFLQFARDHPRWFKWAVFFDAAVTAIAVAFTFVLLGYAAYKTLLQ